MKKEHHKLRSEEGKIGDQSYLLLIIVELLIHQLRELNIAR